MLFFVVARLRSVYTDLFALMMEDSERLRDLSHYIREAPSFLSLRHALRHQFLQTLDLSNAEGHGGHRPSSTGDLHSSNTEALKSTAVDFVVKTLSNNKSIAHIPSTGEQRNTMASRLTRDTTLWNTRAIDAQIRIRWTKSKRNTIWASSSSLTGSGGEPNNNISKQNGGPTLAVPALSAADDALQHLIGAAQREWRALINVRMESIKILTQNPMIRSTSNVVSAAVADGGSELAASPRTSSSNANGACPPIAVDDLYSIVVDRVNQAAAAARKRRNPSSSTATSSTATAAAEGRGAYIDNIGLFSAFNDTVHRIVEESSDGSLVPSLSLLRETLSDLDPTLTAPRVEISHASLASITLADSSFVQMIETGDRPELITAAMFRGVLPSFRRIVYAKCLNVPLTVSTSTSTTAQFSCETKRIRFASANAAKVLSDSAQQGRHTSQQLQGSQDPSYQGRQLLRQMVATDVARGIGDSDKYFVFLDESTAVATAMLEDPCVFDNHLKRVIEQRSEDPLAYLSAVVLPSGMRIPHCGIMPFSCSTNTIGPLNFVTGDLNELYEIAAAMQGQIWAPIQSCTSDLLSMMMIFESLCAHFAPGATFHCFSKLSVSPLSIALRWMVTGFSELLEPVEVLQLWDIILAVHCRAYFGLSKARPHWVLAALAAAIFSLRGALVQQCFSASQVTKLFEDGVKLRPIPLLQQMLFLT